MTREQARNLVIQHTRREDKVDLINSALDLGLLQISQINDFRSAIVNSAVLTLTTGSQTVTLPTDVFQIIDPVRLLDSTSSQNSRLIALKDKVWLEARYVNLGVDQPSNPEYCFVEFGTLIFVPPSGQDWTINFDYYTLSPGLAGEQTQLIKGLEMALISWATAYVFRSVEEFLSSREWMAVFSNDISLAIAADRRDRIVRKAEPFVAGERPTGGPLPWLDPFNPG